MHFVEKCTATKKLLNISCPTELIKTASFLENLQKHTLFLLLVIYVSIMVYN